MDNPQFVATSDPRRLFGALIDIVVSVALAVATIIAMEIYRNRVDRVLSFQEAVMILMLGWAVDILVYAMPLTLWRGSIGNLLTRIRVIDVDTRGPLPFRRAVRRYFARRNVIRWQYDVDMRTIARRSDTTLALPARFLPGRSSNEPTYSHADRVVASAVIRAT